VTPPGGVDSAPKIRIYVEAPLAPGTTQPIAAAQAHYLIRVMRLKLGDGVRVFNGRDGEWLARIDQVGRRGALLAIVTLLRGQIAEAGPWLLFAPVKRLKLDLMVEKATELGVGVLQPVLTRRTVAQRLNPARLRAQTIEAAEQCGRLTLPEIRPAREFDGLLSDWPVDRTLFWGDESGDGRPAAAAFATAHRPGAAFLIGPEGGFEAGERDRLRRFAGAVAIDLGPRILRAETAALAALGLWQAVAGDWRRQ